MVLLAFCMVFLLIYAYPPPPNMIHSRTLPAWCQMLGVLHANSETKIRERTAFLTSLDAPSESNTFREFSIVSMPAPIATLLAAYYPCLWTLEKSPSVANSWDGGKWTCGVPEIGAALLSGKRSKCVIYSAGSNGDDSFEQRIAQHTFHRCEMHVFDPTSAPLPQWSYHQYGVGANDGNMMINNVSYPVKRLETIMTELGHSNVDIFKFDIEGAEWALIDSTPWNRLRFGQIYFEIHGWGGNVQLSNLLRLFERLEDSGYRLFSSEPVCSGCKGQMEFSWIHKEWQPEGFFNISEGSCQPSTRI